MQRNTKRIVGKGVVCLLCFLLGGVATLGITWHLLGQDGRTLLQAHLLHGSKHSLDPFLVHDLSPLSF